MLAPGSTVVIHPALDGQWSRGLVLAATEQAARLAVYDLGGRIALTGEGTVEIVDLPSDRVKLMLAPPVPPPLKKEEQDGRHHAVDPYSGADRTP